MSARARAHVYDIRLCRRHLSVAQHNSSGIVRSLASRDRLTVYLSIVLHRTCIVYLFDCSFARAAYAGREDAKSQPRGMPAVVAAVTATTSSLPCPSPVSSRSGRPRRISFHDIIKYLSLGRTQRVRLHISHLHSYAVC